MPSHLEVWKSSGRQLITLDDERVTVGKSSTNVVSLKDDSTVSRVHAVLEKLGNAWSIRDVGSRNGTYLNGEKISAERVLRSGDELRIGKSKLVFWESKDTDEATVGEATVAVAPSQPAPRLTPRELEVLVVLCRPLVSGDPFPEAVSVKQMAQELFVTEAAVKQHLQNLYDKFAIAPEGERRVRLANEAIRRRAVTLDMLRDNES